MEEYYWRLIYADGRIADEPEEESSILNAPGGAIALVVTQGPIESWKPLTVVYIRDERLPEHSPWVPIFYRKKSLGLNNMQSEAATDLTVFGWGCEGPNEIVTKLWSMRNNKAVDCPEWGLDASACKFLVMEALSGVG